MCYKLRGKLSIPCSGYKNQRTDIHIFVMWTILGTLLLGHAIDCRLFSPDSEQLDLLEGGILEFAHSVSTCTLALFVIEYLVDTDFSIERTSRMRNFEEKKKKSFV